MSIEAVGPRPGDSWPAPPTDRDRWKFRRRMVFAAVGLLAILLIVLAMGNQAEMFGQAIWAFVALVSFYIGAPVADDFLQTRVPRAA